MAEDRTAYWEAGVCIAAAGDFLPRLRLIFGSLGKVEKF